MYKIDDELYFVDLDSHKDDKNILHTECKINKVKINGVFTFKGEDTKYLFEVKGVNRGAAEKDLAKTKEEAIKKSKEIIKSIPIFIENELYIEK